MKYLDSNTLVKINQDIVRRAGEGAIGIADQASVDTIIEQPKISFFGREAYPTIWLKSAFILQKITKKHPFLDGNKRTAFFASAFFLELNGYELNLDVKDGVSIVMSATLSADTESEMLKIAAVLCGVRNTFTQNKMNIAAP